MGMNINKNIAKNFQLPLLVLALLVVNIVALKFHARIDFTNEKRFTLSKASTKLLQKVKEPIVVDVFLKGNYPSGFKRLASSTTDLLQEFKEVAGANLTVNLISPNETMPETAVLYADTLAGMGLVPINLTSQVQEGQQQQLVYPYALVRYQNKQIPVTLYQGKTPLINFQELSSAEATLEYKLVSAISQAMQTEKPIIGYANGNGEPTDVTTYDLVQNTLLPNYQLFTINVNTQPVVPPEFKVLLMVKPTRPFTDEAKFKIDQYVMNGGKLLFFIDRLEAELDSLQRGEVVAYDRDLKLNDLFFKYGARINGDLLMDLQCDYLPFDVNGNGQFELLPWNYFPVLEPQAKHPITKNLGFVSARFINSIDTVEAPGVTKTILLHSSANARTIATPALISGKENETAPQSEKYSRANIPVALLLEGKFTSLYANRLSSSMSDSLSKCGATFLPRNTTNTKIILVADGDMVLNSTVRGAEPIPMGMNAYTYGTQRQFPFANKDFLQNCLDYLVNENDLSEAKAKDYVVRLLDTKKVEAQKTYWQIINIVVPAVIILMFGVGFQWWRKRKYGIRK